MKNLKYLMLHCSATPEGRNVSVDDIKEMHLGPLALGGGKFKFMGKVYNSSHELPIKWQGVRGRGWQQVGYSAVITLDGNVNDLVVYNEDGWVQGSEITNGATGFNAVTRHICYIGGTDKRGNPKDTRNVAQLQAMEGYVNMMLNHHPNILILGHNQAANKACPSFYVPKWLESIGVEKKNIYTADPYGYKKIFK
jgi:N-acetylmuramoyl-L-alanine amidase